MRRRSELNTSPFNLFDSYKGTIRKSKTKVKAVPVEVDPYVEFLVKHDLL